MIKTVTTRTEGVKKTKGFALVMNVTYSFIFIFFMIKTFFSLFLTSVSDKHGNKNKTTIVSQP